MRGAAAGDRRPSSAGQVIGPIESLGRTVALGTAVVLLWAGLEKARRPGSTASTLRELGVSHRWAGPAALSLVVVELVVALSLVVRPGGTVSFVGVVLLGTIFALAGLAGVRRDERIRCGCFGPGHDHVLGWKQVAALPLWIGAAVLARTWAPDAIPAAEAALSLCAAGLLVATPRVGILVRELVKARGDRISSNRMRPWLRS